MQAPHQQPAIPALELVRRRTDVGTLLHKIRDREPLPALRVHHVALRDVRLALHDAAHPSAYGPRLTALSVAPLLKVDCRHGKPADWLAAAARRSAWTPAPGVMVSGVPA